jgi:hypothetical protein
VAAVFMMGCRLCNAVNIKAFHPKAFADFPGERYFACIGHGTDFM